MKILYHHRIRSKDGQYVHLQELIAALRHAGHDVYISGPSAVESKRFGAEAGVIAWLKNHIPRVVYEALECLYSGLDYLRLARDIRRYQPDCIYERYNLYVPSGVWAKRRFGLPLLVEVNGSVYEERKLNDGIAFNGLAKRSEHYCWSGADIVLAVTQVLADKITAAGVPVARVRVVHNAINRKLFQGAPTEEEAKALLGLSGRTVLGFVGFLRSWHGLNKVVDMLTDPNLASCDLLVVGDGPARSELESQVVRLGLHGRVKFTGVVDRQRVAQYISAFDIALQPDVVGYASPLKIYEYLAMGKAIVAPSRPNIQEILTHQENAVLFDPNDVNGMLVAIQTLVRSPELRARLGRAAKRTLDDRNISWEANADRVVSLFQALIESKGFRPREARVQ